MDKKKKVNVNRVAAYALSGVMLASVIPYNVFANAGEVNNTLGVSAKKQLTSQQAGDSSNAQVDATTSATYYKKSKLGKQN